MRCTRFLPYALGAAVVAAGCDGTSASGEEGADIRATASLQFLPAQKVVTIGDDVVFGFGSVGHTVTFDPVEGRPADIPGPAANTQITRTFNALGTFGYHCTIHPEMTGSVVVNAVGAPAGPQAPAPPPPPPSPPYGARNGTDG